MSVIRINVSLSQTFVCRAGAPDVFAQTCPGLCTDYIADPKNFDQAYFELKSIRVYSGGRYGYPQMLHHR